MVIIAPPSYVKRLELLKRLGGDCSAFENLKIITPAKQTANNKENAKYDGHSGARTLVQ